MSEERAISGQSDDVVETRLVSDIVCPFKDPTLRAELDLFRIKFEQETGEDIDLKQRYTSTLPLPQQAWMIKHFPRRYIAGLPEFVQEFLREKIAILNSSGGIDDAPQELITLYFASKKASGYGRAA